MKTTENNGVVGPIGVFDSGFGGIHILKSIVKELPQYEYVYLGDSARNPYGNRQKDEIYEFTKQAVDFLFAKGCELIIFACNTASSDALRKIQQEYLPAKYPSKKVLGVLIPGAEEAAKKTKNKKIGVIATSATVESGAFERELQKIDPGITVFQQACPLLVPIVEAGEQDTKATFEILKNYLVPLINHHVDTLILGCTHYGLLEEKIKHVVGPNMTVISEGDIVAKSLKAYLQRHTQIEARLSKDASVLFYSSDMTDAFTKLGSAFFGKDITTHYADLTHSS